jgi:mRNA interferase RelE/StbE
MLQFSRRARRYARNPRALGKALSGPMGTLWRYRVGDYRIVGEIQHQAVRILVIRIGHRSYVYR